MRTVLSAAAMMLLVLACGSQPAGKAAKGEIPPGVENLVQPTYPEEARKAGIEGTAVVEVTLSEDGAVLACSLATSSGNDLLDAAALSAAQNSKFAPGKKGGKPAVMKVKVPFRFKLADKQSSGTGTQDVRGVARQHELALPAMEV